MASTLPEEGLYQGTIKTWGLKKASTGNPQWVLKVLVTGRANDDNDLSLGFTELKKPLLRTVYNPITPKTVDMVLDTAASLGFKSSSPFDLDPRSKGNPHNFEGTVCTLSCEHDDYKGKVSDKWRISRRRIATPLDAGDMEQLEALYGDKFRAKAEDAPEQTAGQFFEDIAAQTQG